MPSSVVQVRRYGLHAWRISLFIAIILLIHLRYKDLAPRTTDTPQLSAQDASQIIPNVAAMGPVSPDGSVALLDQADDELGRAIQTSPDSNHIIGFSGPTNTLVAFDVNGKISGISILASEDTREHVKQIVSDSDFLNSLNGLTWQEAARTTSVDAVSGATLTSLAIREAIAHRLGGGQGSLKFPDPPKIEDIQRLYPQAATVESAKDSIAIWHVLDAQQLELGTVLRTIPAADNIVGYQGPTETFVGFNNQGRIIGFAIGKSYDNLPYVDYVREDEYYRSVFNDLQLDDLTTLDLDAAEVEGVSGATMTSRAVAEGLIVAAKNYRQQKGFSNKQKSRFGFLTAHDLGTAAVIAAAVAIGLTSLRANKNLRIVFQLILIGYLGLTVGNLLSQAMLVGWAQHGIPWKSAAGLAMLSIAALALPIVTRRNIYCTHLCPHGAAQQLLKRRWSRQLHVPPKVKILLQLIPALLLVWCLVVGMTSLGFSLVDIEPFDAYLFRIAGWATLAIAVVGLVASFFVPMAYCRYGCPTGAVLNYLRFNGRSDRWSVRDSVALGYLVIAVLLWVR